MEQQELDSLVWRVVRYAPDGASEERIAFTRMDVEAMRQLLFSRAGEPAERVDPEAGGIDGAAPLDAWAAGTDIRHVAMLWTAAQLDRLDSRLHDLVEQIRNAGNERS